MSATAPMPARVKAIAVVVRAQTRARVAEALRAAIGLSLRGDRISVFLTQTAHPAVASGDPAIARALATLVELGHTVHRPDSVDSANSAYELADLLRAADAIEVWS